MNPRPSQLRDDDPGTDEPGALARARQTPSGFEQRLLARARAAGFSRGEWLVVGFSGGRDSLALAAALRRVRTRLGVHSLLVHVDHRLRAESGDDARRAQALAQALGLELIICTLPEAPTATHVGVGVEEAARRERYGALIGAAVEAGARAVVTGHHQGDQAETVLLHLLRGGGVHGAAAMGELTAPHDISQEGGIWLWRPLLHEAPAEIEAYVQALDLRPIVDPSNADRALRRNAIRHDVLPLLEERFPGSAAALARYARLAAEDDAFLEQQATEALAKCVDPGGLLIAKRVSALPIALQRRVVRRWLRETTGSAAFTAERSDAVLALAGRDGGGEIEIGEGWLVRRRRGMLRVARVGDEAQGRGDER